MVDSERPPTPPKIDIDELVSFLFDYIEAFGEMVEKVASVERRYQSKGISISTLGEIFRGDPFSMGLQTVDPAKLGRLIQFIFDFAQSPDIFYKDIVTLPPDEKEQVAKRIKELILKYDNLRKKGSP